MKSSTSVHPGRKHDGKATPAQQHALLNAFGGKLGGPLTDLAGLIGEVVKVYPVPIEHRVEGGKGTLRVGNVLEAEMAPCTDAGHVWPGNEQPGLDGRPHRGDGGGEDVSRGPAPESYHRDIAAGAGDLWLVHPA